MAGCLPCTQALGGGVRQKREPGTHCSYVRLIIARFTTWTLVGDGKLRVGEMGVCVMTYNKIATWITWCILTTYDCGLLGAYSLVSLSQTAREHGDYILIAYNQLARTFNVGYGCVCL